MTLQPDRIYHINYTPKGEGFDLIDRVTDGVFRAAKDGMDWCFVCENDDYYPANYFDRFTPYLDKYDFIGDDHTTYYNLINRTFSTFDHGFRATLFTTAFRISSLNLFEWPADGPNLDIHLWKYARHRKRKFIESGTVGIKTGIGLCGGNGHHRKLRTPDPDMEWLKARVDGEAYNFYKSIKL